MGALNMAAVQLLCVYLSAGLMERATAFNRLEQSRALGTGMAMEEGTYQFVMQEDCNLVLYKTELALWATNTSGNAANCFFLLEDDGDARIYTFRDNQYWAVWGTGTCCRQDGDHFIVLQEDGNVVMYNTHFANAIWATNTATGTGGNQ